MRVKKLLGVCLCVFVCVHVLMRVPVCKKLKWAHENKHEILVKRTCVASLLGTCNDCALICTLTGNTVLADYKQQQLNYKILLVKSISNKPKFCLYEVTGCAFSHAC